MNPIYKFNSFQNRLFLEKPEYKPAESSSDSESSLLTTKEDIYSNEVDSEDFDLLVQAANEKFSALQKTHSACFKHAGINKAPQGKKYPPMIEVGMDQIEVKSTKKHQYLGTTGVGVCIAVMARGITSTDETWIALSHSCTQTPKEVFTKIKNKLESNGCELDTIEFFLVGGQLPYRDGPEVCESIDLQIEFLSYAKEFNIVGAQLNLASGNDSLSVIISKDEIVWATELVESTKKHFSSYNLQRNCLVTSFLEIPISAPQKNKEAYLEKSYDSTKEASSLKRERKYDDDEEQIKKARQNQIIQM